MDRYAVALLVGAALLYFLAWNGHDMGRAPVLGDGGRLPLPGALRGALRRGPGDVLLIPTLVIVAALSMGLRAVAILIGVPEAPWGSLLSSAISVALFGIAVGGIALVVRAHLQQ